MPLRFPTSLPFAALLLAALLPLAGAPAPAHAEPRPTRITGGLVLHPDGRIVRIPSGPGAGGTATPRRDR